jgi:large subunit ribosomal protein L31
MREGIHPDWYPEAEMTCVSCGTVWTIGSTVPSLRLDVCSNCHPFYTGEQRIMDTEGQVDRFYKRLQQRDEIMQSLQREEEELSTETDLAEVVKLNDRYISILNDEGIETVQDVLDTLTEKGDDGFLDLPGIGRKVLADVKRGLRNAGFEVPEPADAEPEGATE